MTTYTDLWQASLRYAQLQNHKTHASFWDSVNSQFHKLCAFKHLDERKHAALRYKYQQQIDELKRFCGVS
jgi:hypothetical protein